MLVPKSSRRELRYTSDAENSFLVPKTTTTADALTPRKQRILRPVESNSRLLRKLSDESLASPEKKQRERRVRSGTTDTDVGRRGGLMYAKSLAKSVVRKQASKAKIEVVGSTEAQEAAHRPRSKRSETTEEELALEVDEEVQTSLWCGDEDDIAQTVEAQMGESRESSDDEDDESIVDTRKRRLQPRNRPIISDSESDEDEDETEGPITSSRQPSFEVPERKQEQMPKEESQPIRSMPPPHRKGHSTISNWAQEVVDLTSSPEAPASFALPPTRVRTASFAVSSRPTSSASNGALAILTYSPTPTKFRSPCKAPPISRPSTPPLPPQSPSKLVSPSKKRPTIPKAAHLDGRPSLDAFWNPEVVNEWNEKHSPSKPLVSPRKQKWREDVVKMMESITLEDDSDEGYESPIISPKKTIPSQLRSPTKKTLTDDSVPSVKEVRAQRKDFASRKHAIAEAFLVELDSTICSGRITSLSEATGGIKLVWSKTLKTTAGRANWRREQIRIRTGPLPTDTRTEIRHHCYIELAEKVIDDEERLYNVLAHEFCHLTTFMISEVRNNPHGAEFKSWGKKATAAFANRGVEVTTKHSYQIEYKYIWECIACGYEFKRHSKSIDPAKHSCGRCKGRLAQTKPTPRGISSVDKNGNVEKKEKSAYQVFVKANFSRVQKELLAKGAEAQMGKVMEALGKEYREMKAGKEKAVVVSVDEVELALEGLKM